MNKFLTLLAATTLLLSAMAWHYEAPLKQANIENRFVGREYEHVENIINVFEIRQSLYRDFLITLTPGELEDKQLDGQAAISLYRCDITISNDYVLAEHDTTDILRYKHVMFGLIVRHEIGHCFGLNHSPNPANIMHPTYHPLQETLDAHLLYTLELQEARKRR